MHEYGNNLEQTEDKLLYINETEIKKWNKMKILIV